MFSSLSPKKQFFKLYVETFIPLKRTFKYTYEYCITHAKRPLKGETRAKKRWRRTFKVTRREVGDEEKKRDEGAFGALRDPCGGLREGARNHLSAGSIEEGGSVCSYHTGRERAGWSSYTQKETERGKKRRG